MLTVGIIYIPHIRWSPVLTEAMTQFQVIDPRCMTYTTGQTTDRDSAGMVVQTEVKAQIS